MADDVPAATTRRRRAARGDGMGPSPRPRWWLGACLFLAGAALQSAAWIWLEPDLTKQVFSLYLFVPLTGLSLVVWWTFFSRLTWRARSLGLGLLACAIGLFAMVFRVEGFSGEMLPVFGLRWQPDAQERAEAFRRRLGAAGVHSPDSPARAAVSAKAAPTPAGESPALAATGSWSAEPGDWPGFRGPTRDGVVRDQAIWTDWKRHQPPLLWKHPVGAAWSSFAIAGDRCFTQEQRELDEAVVCYALDTGAELWERRAPGHFIKPPSGEGPRSTPTLAGGRVYALGAFGLLRCLDATTGDLLWSRDVLRENGAQDPEWGTAQSPLVVGDDVVVQAGGADQGGLIAYHRLTGDVRWSVPSGAASYSSPELVTLAGVEQILMFGAAGLAAHARDGGADLWSFAWSNGPAINVAQPIVLGPDRVFIGTGYGTGSTALRVARTPAGVWTVHQEWQTHDLKLKFNGAVLHDGFIYGLDEGILVCLDAQTGARRWKQGRYKYGQLLLIDGLLLIQAESGELALVPADSKGYRELARIPAIDGTSWNQPACGHGRLLVRNAAEAACFDLRPSEP